MEGIREWLLLTSLLPEPYPKSRRIWPYKMVPKSLERYHLLAFIDQKVQNVQSESTNSRELGVLIFDEIY